MLVYQRLPNQPTWRIIPFSKWLGSSPCISHEKSVWKGNHPILRGLINHAYEPLKRPSWDDHPLTNGKRDPGLVQPKVVR